MFLNGQVIFVDKISNIDFTSASPDNLSRKVTITLDTGASIEITDIQGIDVLVNTFIPDKIKHIYCSSIKLVRN